MPAAGALEVGLGVIRVARLGHPQGGCDVADHARFQGVYVRFEQLAFHTQHIDLVLRVEEVLRGGGDADVNEALEGPHDAVHVDDMRADDDLRRGRVHHAIGISPHYALGVLRDVQVVIHREEPGTAAGTGLMCHVGHEPQAIGPGHQRPDAGLRAPWKMVCFHRKMR